MSWVAWRNLASSLSRQARRSQVGGTKPAYRNGTIATVASATATRTAGVDANDPLKTAVSRIPMIPM
jgi:hypothetical protein